MQGSETASQVMLDEGAKTMGVWLPLALSQIYQMLFVLVRMWAKNAEDVKVPTMSETLASFCLPMMSKSMKAEEDEQEALALLKSIERLRDKSQVASRKSTASRSTT